jgi:hypothetical protein
MTDATAIANDQSNSPARGDSDSISISAIAIWAIVQLAAMTLIIARARFWIHAGDDNDALIVMLAAQIVAASSFAPSLMRNFGTAICVTVSALPFLHIAGTIAAADTGQLVRAEIAVVIWLTIVAIAMSIPRTQRLRGVMHAIVNCVSIGGLLLFYLHAEFRDINRAHDFAWFGPLAASITLARRAQSVDSITRAWIVLGALTAIFLVMLIANRVILIARARRA